MMKANKYCNGAATSAVCFAALLVSFGGKPVFGFSNSPLPDQSTRRLDTHSSASLQHESHAPKSRSELLMTSMFNEQEEKTRNKLPTLSAATLSTYYEEMQTTPSAIEWKGIASVITCSLLMTGNTVGAGTLVLPAVSAATGMTVASMLLFGIYALNLVSGLLIAEAAINQYESSGNQAPSSFKEFADSSLKSDMAGSAVGAISLINNMIILSFDLVRGGTVGSQTFSEGAVDPATVSVAMAVMLVTITGVFSSKQLSYLSSVVVAVLFTSFAGLLLPGMSHMHDLSATFFAPSPSGTSLSQATCYAAPILFSSMVYQNIVPSVTKILEYERSKVVATLSLGTLLPTLLYFVFCLTANGGGIPDTTGATFAAFSLAAVVGSGMACSMSIGDELGGFLAEAGEGEEKREADQPLSIPLAGAAVTLPLAAGLYFSNGSQGDFTGALSAAGGYGSPLLYGLLPVLMAWRQRQDNVGIVASRPLVPGGNLSLGALGVATVAFVGQHLASDLGTLL